MKKQISILLLLVYLFSFQEFRQVLKFPFFIEQFVKHQIINEDYSLLGFFKHHYLDGEVLDSDYKEDMKLPFKKITHDFSSNINLYLPIFTEIKLERKLVVIELISHHFKEQNFFISEFYLKIFQPPEFLKLV